MNILKMSFVVFFSVSTVAWGRVEVEVGGGLSKKTLKSDDDPITASSPDLTLSLGYQIKKIPVSFALLVSKKNYDMAAYSKQFASRAKNFYEDSTLFPSPADVTAAESSGSWQGLVYGPQILASMGWKSFDPYLRLSYQVGSLESLVDFKSSGDYLADSLAYDFKIEEELETSLIQYGLGFRVLFDSAYLFLDYGIEKMNAKGSKESSSYRSVQAGVEAISAGSSNRDRSYQLEGQLVRGGLGLRL